MDWSSFTGAFAGGASVQIVIAAVDKYSKEFAKAKTTLQGFSTFAKGFAIAAGGAMLAFVASSVKAAAESEKITFRIKRAYGDMAKEVIRASDEMQDASINDNDAIAEAFLELQKVTKETGMTFEQQKKIMQGSMDLGATYLIDFKELSATIGSATAGNDRALNSLARQFGITAEKGQVLNEVYKLMAQNAGAAQAETDTLYGAFEQLKNIWGDVQKEVGKEFGGELKNLIDLIIENKDLLVDFGGAVITIFKGIMIVIDAINEGLYLMADNVRRVMAILDAVRTGNLGDIGTNLEAVDNSAAIRRGGMKLAAGTSPSGTPIIGTAGDGGDSNLFSGGGSSTGSTGGGLKGEMETLKVDALDPLTMSTIEATEDFRMYNDQMMRLNEQVPLTINDMIAQQNAQMMLRQAYAMSAPVYDYIIKKRMEETQAMVELEKQITSFTYTMKRAMSFSGGSGRATEQRKASGYGPNRATGPSARDKTSVYNFVDPKLAEATINMDTMDITKNKQAIADFIQKDINSAEVQELYGSGIDFASNYRMSASDFYGDGGLVTRPKLAVVGEKGPEMITPVGKSGGMGGNVYVSIGTINGIDAGEISRALRDELKACISY